MLLKIQLNELKIDTRDNTVPNKSTVYNKYR